MFTKGVVYLCKDFQRKVYLGPLKDRQQASFLEAGKKKQQQMYNKCQAWYMRHMLLFTSILYNETAQCHLAVDSWYIKRN
jgi:hypothetical protein